MKKIKVKYVFLILPILIFFLVNINSYYKVNRYRLIKNGNTIGFAENNISQKDNLLFFDHKLNYSDGNSVSVKAILNRNYSLKQLIYSDKDSNNVKFNIRKDNLVISKKDHEYIIQNTQNIIPLSAIDFYIGSLIKTNSFKGFQKIVCLNEITRSVDTLRSTIYKRKNHLYEVKHKIGELELLTVYNNNGQKEFSVFHNSSVIKISYLNYLIPFFKDDIPSNTSLKNINSKGYEDSQSNYNLSEILTADSILIKIQMPSYCDKIEDGFNQKIKSVKNDIVDVIKYKNSNLDEIIEVGSPLNVNNFNLNYTDNRIKKLAKQITLNSKSYKEKISTINSWCYNNIVYKNTSKIDALNVLTSKQGECQGISNLCTSLLLSLKIPAKVVTGIILGENNKIRFHNWIEVFVDSKIYSIDPTWNQNPIDITHIKIITQKKNIDFNILKQLEVLDVQIL